MRAGDAKTVRWLERVSAARGKPVAALASRPTIPGRLRFYLSAFYDLSETSRPTGFDVGRIPVSEIRDYCDLAGVDEVADRFRVFDLVREMDAAFMAEIARRRERDDKPSESRRKRGARQQRNAEPG